MNRRVFLATGLALVGFVRRAWAQVADPSAPIRYTALTRPVRIPTAAVATPWQPVPFVAEGFVQSRRVLINGVVFRRASAAARGERVPDGVPQGDTSLTALCVTCPHEQCQVDLVTDQARLDRMVGYKATHPLFECGCHFSVFDAAKDGARVSGESPRGLYRFRIGGVYDGTVEITEIEEVALSEV